jgi:hypothetical protein
LRAFERSEPAKIAAIGWPDSHDSPVPIDYTRKNGQPRLKRQGQVTYVLPFEIKRLSAPAQFVAGFNTADHFTTSLFTSMANAAWLRASAFGISEPRSSSRLRTFSSSSAFAAAAFSLARIGAGVPLGAKIAFHAEA